MHTHSYHHLVVNVLYSVKHRNMETGNSPIPVELCMLCASHRTDVKSGVSALSSTSTAFGSAAQQAEGMEESLRQQALADEEAAMNIYKV
ncbi:hypothetical protein J6590_018237 [Homalodisca vitripennis]|nr:hypothetical protein J6590_018237 [Homalodisca vitripennis]